MRKNVYLVLLLVIVLSLGAWVAAPAQTTVAQSNQDQTSMCDRASTELVGPSVDIPRVKGLIRDICDFRIRMNQVPKNVSKLDRDYIRAAIISNTLEIQSLQFAIDHATNEEWKGQMRMMLDMHLSDLQMAMDLAKKIGVSTDVDLTDVKLYPETPDYDLGIRRVNLVAEFLDPLMNAGNAGGGTPTTVPGGPTGTVTPPTSTATSMLTNTPVTTPTATFIVPSSTPSGMVTNTPAGTMTGTATLVPPTDTSTGMASNTPVGTLTGTSTAAGPTNTPIGTLTSTSTAVGPTNTPIATTPPPVTGVFSTFDAIALNII